jgi:hypothetical protein
MALVIGQAFPQPLVDLYCCYSSKNLNLEAMAATKTRIHDKFKVPFYF